METSEKKYRPRFVPSINKIEQSLRKSLSLSDDGLLYVEKLLNHLISSLIVPNVPKTVTEAQELVARKIPEPLCTGILEEVNFNRRDTKSRKKLLMSVDKIQLAIKEQVSIAHVDKQVFVFYAAICEYMIKDILKLTVSYIDNFSVTRTTVTDQDIKIAMFADKVLVNIFQNGDSDEEIPNFPLISKPSIDDQSYVAIARNLLAEEQRYLRDIQLIIKLIMAPFNERPDLFTPDDVNSIFFNIEDIAEMTVKLIAMLEEAFEMVDDHKTSTPLIGFCFEDLAEENSFMIYNDYTAFITAQEYLPNFLEIVEKPEAQEYFKEVCVGFRDVVMYVLPHLMLAPIYHCKFYFKQIEILQENTPDKDDECCFKQAAVMITTTKIILENCRTVTNKCNETSFRISWSSGTDDVERVTEIERNMENWDGKELSKAVNELVYDGTLTKITRRNQSERRVFLFDTLMVCCKTNQAQWPIGNEKEFRLKEKISLRRAQVTDHEGSLQFTINDCDSNNTLLLEASGVDEKRAWLSHLFRLQHRSVYERLLEQQLAQEMRNQPLRIPDPSIYRFSEPDIPDENILYDPETGKLKGASVPKLVELLTSHQHLAASFTKTFLITFRSFCHPHRLLDLLLERYNIPEPEPTPEQQEALDRGEMVVREDLKRFRKEFVKPIQLKVLNVIRQWVEHHWFDFEPRQSSKQDESNNETCGKKRKKKELTEFQVARPCEDDLLTRVKNFLSDLAERGNMRKWVRTIQRIVERKSARRLHGDESDLPPGEFECPPPSVQWHTTKERIKFNLLTLHPIELARQLTIRDFDMYRRVHCSELVGKAWSGDAKERQAPNLLRVMRSATRLTHWVMASIVNVGNFEERVAIVTRIVHVLVELKKLNCFNAFAAFACVFNTSAIRRLTWTLRALPERLQRIINENMMNSDRVNMYIEDLQNCDPPCVPFYGSFLTHLFKQEEGTAKTMGDNKLINFASKYRYASLLSDVQQYQQHPYNLQRVDDIQSFLEEDLEPYKGMSLKDFNDWAWVEAGKLEGKNLDRPPRHPRVFSDKDLRMPVMSNNETKRNKTATTSNDAKRNADDGGGEDTIDSDTLSTTTMTTADAEDEVEDESSSPPPPPPPRHPQETPPPVPPRDPIEQQQIFTDAFSLSSSNSACSTPALPLMTPPRSAMSFSNVSLSCSQMSIDRMSPHSRGSHFISTFFGVDFHRPQTPGCVATPHHNYRTLQHHTSQQSLNSIHNDSLSHTMGLLSVSTPDVNQMVVDEPPAHSPPPLPPRDEQPPLLPPRDLPSSPLSRPPLIPRRTPSTS